MDDTGGTMSATEHTSTNEESETPPKSVRWDSVKHTFAKGGAAAFTSLETETGTVSATEDTSTNTPAASARWDSVAHTLAKGGAAAFSSLQTENFREKARQEDVRCTFFPWSRSYQAWWGFTIFWSVLTIFFETYQIAFGTNDSYTDASAVIEYIFSAIFVIDISVNFNLAFYNERDEIVFDRRLIANNYVRNMFWVDFVGVFPFYIVALACAGELGVDSQLAQYLSILRLFRLVRLHRVKQLFEILQYSTKISLMWLTLIRNFGAALVWTHFAACVMFFISRQYGFDPDNTWIGGSLEGLNGFERYVTSLYWSVVTFTTVGYGDFSPVNSAEQIWGMIYMFINMIMAAWIVGSITLLIVKSDEKTGDYRDTLQVLDRYSTMHSFDKAFQKRLKTQLKLDFNNREIADEQVLQHFPTSVRRRVLRRLYLPSLIQTQLMKGIRQQFVDAFLTTCCVEIFSAGEEILQRGSISSDLYLLVEGCVKLLPLSDGTSKVPDANEEVAGAGFESVADSELRPSGSSSGTKFEAGDFVNEIGFFTETPQTDTVRTVTICKTLTMPRTAYKMIAEEHPGSVGRILQNLLAKVEDMAEAIGSSPEVNLTRPLKVLRAGSAFDVDESAHGAEVRHTVASVQNEAALTSVRDLITMHIDKQKDDQTTRFLFAASRGDVGTISLMCDQGFDPNNSDYDSRTALMVAAMKGNTDSVTMLLSYQANPNLVDMHGTSALYEAAKNGHEAAMNVLLEHGAELCMDESHAASKLCQAVYDGDMLTLRRLLQGKIQVNAGDYDQRTAVHIAGAEGNVAAVKILVEFGADLTVKDRWNNTIHDEAKRVSAGQLLEYLDALKNDDQN